MMENKMEQFVTKDMVIGDVLKKYPDVAVIMLEHGLHCVGCHANVFDTIEAGCSVHGLDAEVVDKMVDEMNKFIAEDSKKAKAAAEGPARMSISENAAKKIQELLKKENKEDYALRINVAPGGCSGFVYQMHFDNGKEDNDVILQEHGVKVVVDKESLEMMRGAEIDYVDNLNESGFKIKNPNAKHNCGCGKSFG